MGNNIQESRVVARILRIRGEIFLELVENFLKNPKKLKKFSSQEGRRD